MPSMIDTLGKHLEYENTQKKIVTFFFQFGHSKKETRKKYFKPVLNWFTLMQLRPRSYVSFNSPEAQTNIFL